MVDIFNNVNDVEFRKMFRFTRISFEKLLSLLSPSISTDSRFCNKQFDPIDPRIRLSAALRFFAGGQVHDIKLVHQISNTEFYKSIWLVVDAVNKKLKLDVNFRNVNVLRNLEKGFRSKSKKQVFAGVVGAIDGLLVKTLISGPNGRRKVCHRKNLAGVNVQATCDSDKRFIDFDISFPASTSDTLAWLGTQVYQACVQEMLPKIFHFIGDNAYPELASMLVPCSGAVRGTDEDNYNFYLSQLRIIIEMAFGELVRRFGVLWRPLEVRDDRQAPLIGCLMLLHNFAVEERILKNESGIIPGGFKNDGCVKMGKYWVSCRPRFDKDGCLVKMASRRGLGARAPTDVSETVGREKRENIMQTLRDEGLVRPAIQTAAERRRTAC